MIALPPLIEQFFNAKNARDFAGAASAFSPAAIVIDEGGRSEGPAAIRAWIERTSTKYNDHAEPKSATSSGTLTAVDAQVSGTFPGSPATIRFTFTLSGGRIDRLEIR